MTIRRFWKAAGALPRRSLLGSLLFAMAVAGCELIPAPGEGPDGLRSPSAPEAPAPSGSRRTGATEPVTPSTETTQKPEPAPPEIVALPPPKPQPKPPAEPPTEPPAEPTAVSPAEPQAPAVSETPPAAPAPDLRRLIGSNEAQVVEVLGPPDATRQSPPATIWRYDLEGCRVDVFFYLDLGSQTLRALSYELSEIPGEARAPEWCVPPPEKSTRDGAQ